MKDFTRSSPTYGAQWCAIGLNFEGRRLMQVPKYGAQMVRNWSKYFGTCMSTCSTRQRQEVHAEHIHVFTVDDAVFAAAIGRRCNFFQCHV
jgi:hypothetical protein